MLVDLLMDIINIRVERKKEVDFFPYLHKDEVINRSNYELLYFNMDSCILEKWGI